MLFGNFLRVNDTGIMLMLFIHFYSRLQDIFVHCDESRVRFWIT